MKLKSIAFALSVVGVSAVSGGNAALAADERTYPGTLCESVYGGSDITKLLRAGNSAWANGASDILSDGRIAVTCPIIKNYEDSAKAITVYARIYSNNDQATQCRIISHNWNGASSRNGASVEVKGSNVRTGVTVNGPEGYSGGSHELFCYLPNGSRIINYHVFEY